MRPNSLQPIYPIVLADDYNVVANAVGHLSTRSLDNNALIQPESREAFARLLAQGWTDALRKLYPTGALWTFWDYENERWQQDKGMRLDHLLLSPTISNRARGMRGRPLGARGGKRQRPCSRLDTA
ncbi:MAG: hypothetical protein WA672_21590 [Candidatus Angelobacter sp.]